jgi:hypothetical protein
MEPALKAATGSTPAPFARLLTTLRFASLPVTLNVARAGVKLSQPCLSGTQSDLDCDTSRSIAHCSKVSLIFTLPCTLLSGKYGTIDLLAGATRRKRGLLENRLRNKNKHLHNYPVQYDLDESGFYLIHLLYLSRRLKKKGETHIKCFISKSLAINS